MLGIHVNALWCTVLSFAIGLVEVAAVLAVFIGIVLIPMRIVDSIQNYLKARRLRGFGPRDYEGEEKRRKLMERLGVILQCSVMLIFMVIIAYGIGSPTCDALFKHTP